MSYVPNTPDDKKRLSRSLPADLFADIPAKIRSNKEIKLPPPLSEPELLEELCAQSEKNIISTNFLGAGSYNNFVPSVVKHMFSRSEFSPAYPPYQAEMSQGILQAIYEYQTMICELTGMEAANASMYDGATAMAEAARLACRATGIKEIVVSPAVHPEYRKTLKTYANGGGLTVRVDEKRAISNETACLILQQPNFFGCIEEVAGLADKVHANGSLFIVSADPISLGLLKAPGDYGADIVVGEGQSLGNPQSFGGPALGIFAVSKKYLRQIPGRVVGQTTDADGKRGFCLTLQTREQHIRREKAASNICSNEALVALAATVYLSVMGRQGLRKVAELCLQKANYLKKKLKDRLVFSCPSFKEFVIKTDRPVGLDLSQFYPEMKNYRLICVTELTKKQDLDYFSSSI